MSADKQQQSTTKELSESLTTIPTMVDSSMDVEMENNQPKEKIPLEETNDIDLEMLLKQTENGGEDTEEIEQPDVDDEKDRQDLLDHVGVFEVEEKSFECFSNLSTKVQTKKKKFFHMFLPVGIEVGGYQKENNDKTKSRNHQKRM